MNNYIKNSLQSDEKVIMKANINGIIFIIPALLIIASVIIICIPFKDYVLSNNYDERIGQSIIVMLLFLIIKFSLDLYRIIVYKYCSILVVTNKRVLSKKGLLNIITLDSPINKINDFNIEQTLLGKIFEYSKVIIKTSSSSYSLNYVRNAEEFKNAVVSMESSQGEKQSKDKYDELIKLKELLDKNIITKEEFDKEKKKILDK